MATEAAAIYNQDPFIYNYKDNINGLGLKEDAPKTENLDLNGDLGFNGYWGTLPCSAVDNSSFPGQETRGDRFFAGSGGFSRPNSRRKRQRIRNLKNEKEMENQRVTHIEVERNRRRQMNEYLAIVRSLMPPSYSQRGDQASIVGGAINYVKELEHLLQFLESHKLSNQKAPQNHLNLFSNFFTFPQYSTCPIISTPSTTNLIGGKLSAIADIEVTLVDTHANIKILSKRRPTQLLKMVFGLESNYLTILHLNITTVDQSTLYCFSVQVADQCKLTTAQEIATIVHDMMGTIQEGSMSSEEDKICLEDANV